MADGALRPLIVDPSQRGGLVLYTRVIAESLVAAGAQPQVLGSRALPTSPVSYSVLRRLPSAGWGRPANAGLRFYAGRAATWFTSALLVEVAARTRGVDVIHFQAALNRRFDARLISHLHRRLPVVWTAHDVLPFERSDTEGRWFAGIYRAVDVVIVHGERAAEELELLAGVQPTVIAHPVPSDVVRVTRAEARSRLGVPDGDRIVAALGFIRDYKGYGLLADVWERLGDAAPLLLVMGELMSEGERETVARLERSTRVVLRLGYADDTDLQLAVAAADVLVLPYVEASESGLVHLARALGVPVLASDVPQLAAAIVETKAGAVVPRALDRWCEAVVGPLPPAPPPPPELAATGRAHLEAYELARRRRHR